MLIRLTILTAFIFSQFCLYGQDSTCIALHQFPTKYAKQVAFKIDKYYFSITSKTEKTLEKLTRWEEKIHSLLQNISPETAAQLFGNNQLTFASLLKEYRESGATIDGFRAQYNEYQDKLTNTFKYLDENKDRLDKSIVQPVKETKEKINLLNKQLDNTETIKQFIKERKKLLIQQSLQYIGKGKYLKKINKEAYYYIETIKNYREIFSDTRNAEEFAVNFLQKIPAFNEYLRQNSMLSSVFGGVNNNNLPTTNYASFGYQSNAMVAQQIQQWGLGGTNNIQSLTNSDGLNSPLQHMKSRFPNHSNTEDIPDFKPNEMKSKTFKQRL